MNLDLDARVSEFRAEVASWLAAHVPAQPLPSVDTAEGFARHRAFEAELADARVLAALTGHGGADNHGAPACG